MIWGALGYLSVSSGVSDANKRLPQNVRAVLTPQTAGSCSPARRTILLLGTDHATERAAPAASADQHSDSMMLLHTDPGRHRLVYLSIPRDLRAAIPGYGAAEDQRGDAARRAEARDPDG